MSDCLVSPFLSWTYERSSSFYHKMDGLRVEGALLKRPYQHAVASQPIALMDRSRVVSCARALMDDSDMRDCSLRERGGKWEPTRDGGGVRSSPTIIKKPCIFLDWKLILNLYSCRAHIFGILNTFTHSLNTRAIPNTKHILTRSVITPGQICGVTPASVCSLSSQEARGRHTRSSPAGRQHEARITKGLSESKPLFRGSASPLTLCTHSLFFSIEAGIR